MNRMRSCVWLATALFFVSCRAQKNDSVAYEQHPEEAVAYESAGISAPAPASAPSAAWGADDSMPRSEPRSRSAKSGARPKRKAARELPLEAPVDRPQQTEVKEAEPAPARMVVYTGYLKLRVPRLMEAADQLTAIAEEMGGYVDSLSSRHVVLRIPAADFDQAMAALAGVGETLARRISAQDVTAQFTDLSIRLDVARDARERLLMLLEKTKDTRQRLRILHEIKRLTEQIETIEAQLTTLESLVAFCTITVELQPVSDLSGRGEHRSPFEWIRQLSPYQTTIEEGMGDFTLELPKEFFLFEEADVYTAHAADTTILRGGVVDNEPLGDAPFWLRAIQYEMDGRGEVLVDQGESGPMSYLLYRNDDVEPRYYLVALFVAAEDLYVLEVFFPHEDARGRHLESVQQSLAGFALK